MEDPKQLGQYVIRRRIGAGGMGTVYEATHLVRPGRFALKTLQSETPNGGIEGIRALRREVEVLANLDHPHIVKVVDFELDGAEPWFAMEYVQGRPLSGWHSSSAGTLSSADTIREVASRTSAADWSQLHDFLEGANAVSSPSTPPSIRVVDQGTPVEWEPDASLRTRLSWLGQLARALQFLHGEGLVHADVKPDNVLVREDGWAVLVDFGLVSRIGRRVTADELRRARTQAQTLEYAAPERLLTSTLDSRADLYALGCMLFETFAGTPPFTGPPPAVAIAHVSMPPPIDILRDLAEPPPPALIRLIAELLQKDPTLRTPYAAHVCAVLEDHGVATTASNERPRPARSYLHRPALVGLQDQIAKARDTAYEVRSGAGVRRVDVVGPPGSGKSRLTLEIMHHARGVGFDVHVVEAVEDVSHTLPFTCFKPILQDVVDRAAAQSWSPGASAVWLARLEPRLAKFLSDSQRETLEQLEAANHADVIDATARALAGLLVQLSAGKPTMLLAELPAQLDAGSRRVIQLVEEGSVEGRWLVVTTASDGNAAGSATTIDLPPLQREHVARFAAQLFGTLSLDDGLVDLLNDVCRRRPGPLFEFVHALLEGGLVEQDHRGSWRGKNGITLLQACERQRNRPEFEVGRRIALLPDELREVGGAAACLGRHFELADLVAVHREPARVYIAVNELLRLGFLAESEGPKSVESDRFAFTTDVVRRSFYDRCPEPVRKAAHASAAKLLAERGDPAAVARHLQGAGDSEGAYQAWLDAAALARRRSASRVEGECLASAVRTAPWLDPSEREHLLIRRFETLIEVGTTDEVQAEAETLRTGVKSPARRAELLRHLMRRAFISGLLDEMKPHLEELERAAAGADIEARIHAKLALAGYEAGRNRYEAALQLNQLAEEDATDFGNDKLLFEALSRVAWSNSECGQPNAALQKSAEAGNIAASLGIPEFVSANRNSRAVMQMQMGLYRDARPSVEDDLQLARRAQLPWRTLIGVWNLAVGDYQTGMLRRVVPALMEMEQLRLGMALRDDDAPYLGLHGRVLSRLGDHDAGIRLIVEAIDCTESKSHRTIAQLAHVQALLLADRIDDAVDTLQPLRGEHALRHRGDWALMAGSVASAIGEYDIAEEQFAEALDIARGKQLGRVHSIMAHQAKLLQRRGRLKEAAALLMEVLSWYDVQQYRYGAALARLELAALLPKRADQLLADVDAYLESQPFEPDAELLRLRGAL